MTFRSLFTVLIILLWTCVLSAQPKFFFDASGNYSISQDMEQIYWRSFADPVMTHNLLLSEHFAPKPGIDFNVGVSKNIYKKFNLTAGIGISAVQFERTFSVDIQNVDPYSGIKPDYTGFYWHQDGYDSYPSPDEPLVLISDQPRPLYERGYNWLDSGADQNKVGQTEIVYLTIPIGIQYPVTDKLVVGMGVKNAVLTYSRQVKQGVYPNNQRVVYTDKTSDGLSNNLLSGDVSLQYHLFKQIWLSTSYNHYFTPVYDENQRMAGDLKYRTFRMGLKYDL